MLRLGVMALVVAIGSFAFAQNEESEETRLAAEKAKRRHYAGGHDEQELTVQAALPIATRYPADPKAPAAGGTKAEPAQEDLHD